MQGFLFQQLKEYCQEALRGISAVASDNEYDILISSGRPNEYLSLRNLAETCKVDRIIILRAHLNDKSIKFLHNAGFMFVLIGSSKGRF